MSSVSACACASRAANISDDVSTSVRPAAVGHIISDSTQADLVDDFVLHTTTLTDGMSGYRRQIVIVPQTRKGGSGHV
jgi:hypothetical protein